MSNKKNNFTRDDRKYIVNLIENLKDVEDYQAVYDILINDKSSDVICSTNNNGVCLNLSVVGNDTLIKVRDYLDRHNKKKQDIEINNIPIVNNSQKKRTHKLSNHEESLLRHREIKKAQENEVEYKELKFSSKKTRKTKKDNTIKN